MIFAGDGNDTVRGNNTFDFIDGGAGNDKLHGGGGTDYLIGGRGNDTLDGGDGRDVLSGGSGNDTMTGGNGPDLFLFTGGKDTITDFKAGEDTLLLGPGRQNGRNPSESWKDKVTIKDGNAVVDFGDGNILTLDDVSDVSNVDAFNLFC